MIVWITKYALTQGILKAEAEVSSISERMISIEGGRFLECFHKPHWHTTEEDALAQAEEMRRKKIASLKKSLDKIEKMKIKISDFGSSG